MKKRDKREKVKYQQKIVSLAKRHVEEVTINAKVMNISTERLKTDKFWNKLKTKMYVDRNLQNRYKSQKIANMMEQYGRYINRLYDAHKKKNFLFWIYFNQAEDKIEIIEKNETTTIIQFFLKEPED